MVLTPLSIRIFAVVFGILLARKLVVAMRRGYWLTLFGYVYRDQNARWFALLLAFGTCILPVTLFMAVLPAVVLDWINAYLALLRPLLSRL